MTATSVENIDAKPEEIQTETPELDLVHQRLKEFSFYFVQSVELNLSVYLTLLEDRSVSKSNSAAISGIGALSCAIPTVGKGISSALQKGELFVLNKIDKKNSRTLAALVYDFSDDREGFRKTLIEASTDLFFSFENQFLRLTCDGGPKRAMMKLAKDAVQRAFKYILGAEDMTTGNLSKDDITKGIFLGESTNYFSLLKKGRTIKDEDERTWKTTAIYRRVGLVLEETKEFFKTEESKCWKYGYRRPFPWEDIEEIRNTWKMEIVPEEIPKFVLNKEDFSSVHAIIRKYIMSKTPEEEAKLDREQKHEETLKDHSLKHSELLSNFQAGFEKVFDELSRIYTQAVYGEATSRQPTIHTEEITSKLSDIHKDVVETKEGQVQLQQEIYTIKSQQVQQSTSANAISEDRVVEIAKCVSSEQPIPNLADIIKDNYEVKKVTRIINEFAKSKPEEKVKAEIDRTTKKIANFFKI